MSQEHLYLQGPKRPQGLPNKDADMFPRCLTAKLAFPGTDDNNDTVYLIQSEFLKAL